MSEPKVIARIKGGLGNQLFCYAAARRLALKNRMDLVLDCKTGFSRDKKYRREYGLDNFSIPCRKATPVERMEPFERYRRGARKFLARRRVFDRRSYIEQCGSAYDPRLLELKVNRPVYLDGYWQSEWYFEDIADQIRRDLRMPSPRQSIFDEDLPEEIGQADSVVVHVRFFNGLERCAPEYGAMISYYRNAMSEIEGRIGRAKYFLFSDRPAVAMELFKGVRSEFAVVAQRAQTSSPYADLWLMSQARNLILANSTFSWWAAWLAEGRGGNAIVCPETTLMPNVEWGFAGMIPSRWTKVKVGV